MLRKRLQKKILIQDVDGASFVKKYNSLFYNQKPDARFAYRYYADVTVVNVANIDVDVTDVDVTDADIDVTDVDVDVTDADVTDVDVTEADIDVTDVDVNEVDVTYDYVAKSTLTLSIKN